MQDLSASIGRQSLLVVITGALIILGKLSPLSAQNLVPNGSFEATDDFTYEFPFSAFPFLRNWRTASFQLPDQTPTTPDLFITGAPLSASSPPTFWNIVTGPSNGNNYVGLINVATRDGAFFPEAITTELTEPLIAGELYVISLDYRNKGEDTIHPSPMECIEEAQKKLQIYLSEMPVEIALDDVANISVPSASPTAELTSPSMLPYEVSGWETLSTCFVAAGGERHLTISMISGRAAVFPPCEIVPEDFDIFLNYYFDVDNVQLERVPNTYEVSSTSCAGQPIFLNLRDSLDFPAMLEPSHFSLGEETFQDLLILPGPGQHTAYAHLDCTVTPINITVTPQDCTPRHYAPTAFSPNSDGINDEWNIRFPQENLITDFQLSIYDRWGASIFATQNPEEVWSGTVRGELLQSGTYTWAVSYVYQHPILGPLPQQDGGEIQLIR